ncbi:hypothetical protein [Weissella cibaria]|uniref:hypothetical protein n=1 Tax=Weissella cibaria TaxID=137591 RepID=UPI0022E5C1E5|nr:hypothetical protein [Weissella cibaria]
MAEEAQVQAAEQVAAVEAQPAVQAPVVETPKKKVSRFGEQKVVEIKQDFDEHDGFNELLDQIAEFLA